MKRSNQQLRAYLKRKKVYQYELAEQMGLYETALTRKLRTELTVNEQQRLMLLVDQIAEKHEEETAKEEK